MKGDTHTLSIVPLRSPFGIVDTDNDSGLITGFAEKPIISDMWINAGVYHLSNEIFNYLLEKGDFEATVLPMLAREDKLKSIRSEKSYWRSIDSHKDLEEASMEFLFLNLLKQVR